MKPMNKVFEEGARDPRHALLERQWSIERCRRRSVAQQREQPPRLRGESRKNPINRRDGPPQA